MHLSPNSRRSSNTQSIASERAIIATRAARLARRRERRVAAVRRIVIPLLLLGMTGFVGAEIEHASAGASPVITEMGFFPVDKVASYVSLESFVGHQTKYVVQVADAKNAQAFTGSVWGEVTDVGKFQMLNNRLTFVLSVPLTIGLGFGSTPAQRAAALEATRSGANDVHIKYISKLLVDAGYPDAIIRLGWEYDGDWMPWSAIGNEALWVNAYRHVHDVMQSVSPEFQYDFNGDPGYMQTEISAYPGDNYVDIIGTDVYDQPPNQPWSSTTKSWVNPTAAWAWFLPKLQWQRDFAIAHGKTVSYPEWGLSGVNTQVTSNVGGDNPTFIQGMYDWMNSLPENGPGSLEYHSYFNQDPDSNHRIDAGHFPNASARFQTLFGNTTPTTSPPTSPTTTPATVPATSPTTTTPSTVKTPTTLTTPPVTTPATTPATVPDSPPPEPAAPQVIDAQASTTNGTIDAQWPNSQSNAYVHLDGVDREFVRFAFTSDRGPTRLSLRYSSSVRAAYRTIKVDGRVIEATQKFTATRSWGRWRTLSIDKQLTAGTHTLEVVFESTADSVGPLNLDNLKVSPSSDTMKQVIAAGTAETNIATETRWPGAANAPYLCCWNTDGQYVKFAFDAGDGATTMTLRYSAADDNAHRTITLDGVVLNANRTFPATADWSTWQTSTITRTLTAGPHTLEVSYDDAANSAEYMNLDNLTVDAA